MRVLLDTNVLVAAFATRGLCEDVLRVVLAEHELLTSPLVLEELERIPAEKLRMPPNRAREVTLFVRQQSQLVEPAEPAPWPQSDPDDRWVVAAAIEGAADVLVTGDRDLLSVQSDLPVPAVSPRGFWERLR